MNWLLWTVGVPQTPRSEARHGSDLTEASSAHSHGEDDVASHIRQPNFPPDDSILPAVDETTSESRLEQHEDVVVTRSMSPPGPGSAILSDTEEDSFSFEVCTCCKMLRNCFAPFYRQAVCTFHVLRSVPGPTIFTYFVTLAGWVLLCARTQNLEEALRKAGLHLKQLEYAINSYGAFLISVNSVMAVTTTLLTGWTREALCASIHSGSFDYPGGNSVECGCWSRCLYRSGFLLLAVMIGVAYASLIIAVLGILVAGIAWFIGYIAMVSCRTHTVDCTDTLYEDTQALFNTVLKAIQKLTNHELGIDTFRAEDYCENRVEENVRVELAVFMVGQFLIVFGQMNFVSIMIAKNSAVRYEERLKHHKEDQLSPGIMSRTGPYAPLDTGDWEQSRVTRLP